MQAHLEFTAGNQEKATTLLKECLAIQEDRCVCMSSCVSCLFIGICRANQLANEETSVVAGTGT